MTGEALAAAVPRGTEERLRSLQHLIITENRRQSLVSPLTIPDFWARHVVDSLQLLPLAPAAGTWLDIGSGAGLPGLVVAIASPRSVILVEPRRLRADFLKRAAILLDLGNVTVVQAKVEQVSQCRASVISARAVAPTISLFAAAQHLADNDTVWLLPRGRSAQDELARVTESWQGHFRLEPSSTDPDAGIIIASHVEPKGSRR